MEESERRKERLRTLRLEAEQQPVQAAAEAETLPSPLLREASDPSTSRDTSFDYYTDPLAVYAGIKRKGGGMLPKPSHRAPPPLSGVQQAAQPPLLMAAPAWTPAHYVSPPVVNHSNPEYRPNFTQRGAPPPQLHGYPGPPPSLQNPRRGRGSGHHCGGRGGFFPRQGGHASGTNAFPASSESPVSAEQHPELFYSKSMVEDPWRHLVP